MKVFSRISVRKGAWSTEEDDLLRKCVEQYGEGGWHQVPLRAGLNRCRKSCRLRWLNYLKPNIKRGNFAADEVDLIIRLHNLLGNRWSLIAGRLPGRTANDIKNYWNTHLRKKTIFCKKDLKINRPIKITKANIIKPQPRTFSNKFFWSVGEIPVVTSTSATNGHGHEENNNTLCMQPSMVRAALPPEEEEERMWWEKLLLDNGGSSSQEIKNNHTSSLNNIAEANGRNVGRQRSPRWFPDESEIWWINNNDDIGIWDLVPTTEMDKTMI